jgi:hypothetical protein
MQPSPRFKGRYFFGLTWLELKSTLGSQAAPGSVHRTDRVKVFAAALDRVHSNVSSLPGYGFEVKSAIFL